MCMKSGGDSGAQILAQQQQQQGQINTGMEQLNRIFQGGTVGTGVVPQGGFNPGGTYYDALGNKVQGGQAKGLFDTGQLFSGQTQEKGFGPDFYNQRQQDYLNFATPQVEEQYGKTLGSLTNSLSNQGLRHSSVSDKMQGSLQEELSRQLAGQSNLAMGQSQDLQKQVAQEQAQLTQQLQQSANPAQTSVQALQASSQLQAPSVLQPLGNLFSNWSSLYGTNQMQNAYSSLLNQQQSAYPFFNMQSGGGQFAGLPQNSVFSGGLN